MLRYVLVEPPPPQLTAEEPYGPILQILNHVAASEGGVTWLVNLLLARRRPGRRLAVRFLGIEDVHVHLWAQRPVVKHLRQKKTFRKAGGVVGLVGVLMFVLEKGVTHNEKNKLQVCILA